MPQEQSIEQKLAGAKAFIAQSNTALPPRTNSNQPAAKPAAAPAAKMPTTMDELAVKKTMVDKAMKALPKMHDGGPITADGAYQLKAGEHVLTAREADRAKKHALMHAGMRSMAVMPKKPMVNAASGDKHVETATSPNTAPAPKPTARAGKASPITVNAKVSGHNLNTTSSSPKATDKGSKKMASMASGMGKLVSARGKVSDTQKVRPEQNQGAKIVDKTKTGKG